MCDWEGVTDVNALKAMLAAQQAQLQELQTTDSDKSGNRNASKKEMATRKRKSQPVVDDDFEFEALVSEDEQQQEVESEEYDPEDDSSYDAPRKSTSSRKKGTTSGSKAKKGRRAAADRDTDSEDDVAAPADAAKVAKAAAAALRSVKSAINAQMVYKPSIKYGQGRVSLELPCLSLAVINQMLGPDLVAKASNGKKQLQLKASNDDLDQMFEARWGGAFCKSLRYGATLGLVQGLTFTYNKSTQTLKVHGMYRMFK